MTSAHNLLLELGNVYSVATYLELALAPSCSDEKRRANYHSTPTLFPLKM